MWFIVLACYLVLLAFSPFILWRSFFAVMRAVTFSMALSFKQKLRLAWHLIKELVYAPALTLLWIIDDLIFSAYRFAQLNNPVFIVSQPRSGTTFLLRTLSQDSDTFFSLKHLEWRFPFIALWKLIDFFGLRYFVESIDYWPDTELGRLASKIHHHKLGSVEEHGIFFEERMYHHYFTFRRFPLPEVLRRVTDIKDLTKRERKKLVRTFKKVVQKVAYYRGAGRIWLTKENESVDLYRILRDEFPSAHFLTILREPKDFVSSYITMSQTCTMAKHGIDPQGIEDWREVNMQFRLDECEKLIAFSRELEKGRAITYTTFLQFTTEIKKTVERIYTDIGASLSGKYTQILTEMQTKQDGRESGYINPPCRVDGFEMFERFVRSAESQESNPIDAPHPKKAYS